MITLSWVEFQSTLPIREETRYAGYVAGHLSISIHSSHTGRDYKPCMSVGVMDYFNPLFPYGKRQPAV